MAKKVNHLKHTKTMLNQKEQQMQQYVTDLFYQNYRCDARMRAK